MKGITKELEEFQSAMTPEDFRLKNILRMIPKANGRALDIGAGSGFITIPLSKRFDEVYSIDYSKKLVNKIKKITKDIDAIKVLYMNAESLTFKENFFDLVVIADVLEHIERDTVVLHEIYRVLKKKGKLFIVVPAFQSLYGKRDERAGHYRRYSKKELRKKLSGAGFVINKMRFWNALGFFPYLFSEKILKKELNPELRKNTESIVNKTLNSIVNLWFKHIENRISLWFGLSLICVARKDE